MQIQNIFSGNTNCWCDSQRMQLCICEHTKKHFANIESTEHKIGFVLADQKRIVCHTTSWPGPAWMLRHSSANAHWQCNQHTPDTWQKENEVPHFTLGRMRHSRHPKYIDVCIILCIILCIIHIYILYIMIHICYILCTLICVFYILYYV